MDIFQCDFLQLVGGKCRGMEPGKPPIAGFAELRAWQLLSQFLSGPEGQIIFEAIVFSSGIC